MKKPSLSTLLIIIYVIIIIIVIVFLFATTCERNYMKRALPLQKCPFKNKLDFKVIKIHNKIACNEGIVSYSLYGNYKKYSVNLIKSLKLIPDYLPNWHARVYVGSDIPNDILHELTNGGAEVYIMGPDPPRGFEGSLWRFAPLTGSHPFICLDADDVLTKQIANDTKKWMKTNKQFISFSKIAYIVPLAAGLWGAKPFGKAGNKLVDHFKAELHKHDTVCNNNEDLIQEHINTYCEHWFGFDEAYLKTNIWPLFKKYGYYQCSNLHLQELTILFVLIILALMIYTVYKAKQYGV